MTPREAYTLLEIAPEISEDDLKIKYKDLAKKYHPDIYKEDPNKFKQINEAYQLVQDYRANPSKYEPKMSQPGFWGAASDLGDIIFNTDFFKNIHQDEDWSAPPTPVSLTLQISFHESILGCMKEITYNRSIKCSLCKGAGKKHIGNGCDKCDGFGRVTINNKGMIFQTSCSKCHGKNTQKPKCEQCNGKKVLDDKRIGSIAVPAGHKDGELLRLAGEGNFAGGHMFGDAYTDVLIKVQVTPYKDMQLKNHDVHSKLDISLLDALQGAQKEIETIYGNKTIQIPAKSRHAETISIDKCGVQNTKGAHIVNLNIEYPTDVSAIIGALKDVHDPM